MFIIFIHFPLEEWSIVGFSGWSGGIPAMSFRNDMQGSTASGWGFPWHPMAILDCNKCWPNSMKPAILSPKQGRFSDCVLWFLWYLKKHVSKKRKHQAPWDPWVNVLRHHAHECDTGQTVHTSIHEGTVEFQLFVTGNGILRIFGSSTCLKDFKTVKCLEMWFQKSDLAWFGHGLAAVLAVFASSFHWFTGFIWFLCAPWPWQLAICARRRDPSPCKGVCCKLGKANKLQLKILCQQKYCKNHAKRSVQQGGALKNRMVYNGSSSFHTKIAKNWVEKCPNVPSFSHHSLLFRHRSHRLHHWRSSWSSSRNWCHQLGLLDPRRNVDLKKEVYPKIAPFLWKMIINHQIWGLPYFISTWFWCWAVLGSPNFLMAKALTEKDYIWCCKAESWDFGGRRNSKDCSRNTLFIGDAQWSECGCV